MSASIAVSRSEPGAPGPCRSVRISEKETLTAQLATLGYTPGDVGTAILSHLHQDHIGGLPELTDTRLLVSAAEWAELSQPRPELRGLLRQHIELPGLQ
jgi:N-acyl homoserine lactone hydrolase